MKPLGDSRPDWEIFTDLAARLGHPWHYPNPGAIMAEAASIAEIFAGVSYEQLVGCSPSSGPSAPQAKARRDSTRNGLISRMAKRDSIR